MNDQDYVAATDISGEERTSGKAIASLVLGLLSPLLCLFTGIPALILGILGLSEINRSGGRVKGQGMAITGTVLGGLATVMTPTMGILIALLLPAVQAARSVARQTDSMNNMKQIGVAMHNYHEVHGCFPPAITYDEQGRPMHSWRVLLLPYLDGTEALYDQYDFDQPWDSVENQPLLGQIPSTYQATPPNADPTTTGYVVIVGRETMFPPDGVTRVRDVTDGLSNTILTVEQTNSGIPWTEPRDLDFDSMDLVIGDSSANGPRGSISGKAHLGMADGSVLRLSDHDVTAESLKSMITPAGGEGRGFRGP